MTRQNTIPAVLALSAVLFLTAGCDDLNSSKSNNYKAPKPTHFTLGIEQDGQPIPVDKLTHTVHLKKAPFKVIFYFEEMSSMLVQASFQPNLMQKAEIGEGMETVIRQDGTIVEDLLNPDFTLYVSEDGLYHNWLYMGPKVHRFDADKGVQEIPENEGGGFYCVRTVKNLDENGQTVPIENCSQSKIYMVFFKVDRIPGSQRRAERQRDWLVLDFGK